MAVSLVPSVLRTKANIASATTDGAVIAAVSGKKIRVLGFILQAGGTATTVVFNTKPGGAGTAVSAVFDLLARGGTSAPIHNYGWFETSSGEGLTVTTGTGSSVGVQVVYTLLPG
jgi:hypothetical protein